MAAMPKIDDCAYGTVTQVIVDSPIGDIHISSCPQGLHAVGQNSAYTDENFAPNINTEVSLKESRDHLCLYSPLIDTIAWLKLYFQDSNSVKNLNRPSLCPSLFKGKYREKVWLTLAEKVNIGSTVSYSELANLTSNPKAARSVGTAMKTNPIQLIIPCHRVIRNGGLLGSYADGRRNKTKHWLLEHEGYRTTT